MLFTKQVAIAGYCSHNVEIMKKKLYITTLRVCMGPGKSWNFIMAFSRTGKSWKRATGPGKFWKFVKLS